MKSIGEHFVFWGVFCHLLLRASFQDQQEKKTDRSGLGWWDPDPNWLSESMGLLSPPIGPPLPLRGQGGPPAPLDQGRPPAPLDQGRPPSPLVQPPAPMQNDHVTRGGVHAEDIQCVRSGGVTLLSAVVVPPPEFVAQPVFEDASPDVSAECGMRPSGGDQRRTFAMHVQHFARCGVRVQQAADGKEWISVTLRFPLVEGLRSAEDEYVMVMCRPQDKVRTTQHVMDMRGTAVESRSVQPKKVFRSGPRDVSCRLSLMSRGADNVFEMKSGAAVRVGQQLQIRAVVREGDGWNYAMLKDVVISRKAPRTLHYPNFDVNSIDIGDSAIYRDQRQEEDVAQLVSSDGCRNPQYRAVAPLHPQRDPQRPLAVSFSFQAFMFQDMADGESLRLSAQVVACAELADCQQSSCDAPRGVGKKKRKRRNDPRVANFSDDFELTVSLGGFSKIPLVPSDARPFVAPSAHCKLLLMSVCGAALLFCLCITAAAAIVIGGKRKELTRKH